MMETITRAQKVAVLFIVAVLLALAAMLSAPAERPADHAHPPGQGHAEEHAAVGQVSSVVFVDGAQAHTPFPKWCGERDNYAPWLAHGYNYNGHGGWQNDGDHFHTIAAVKHRNTGNWTGSYQNVKCGHNFDHHRDWPRGQYMG